MIKIPKALKNTIFTYQQALACGLDMNSLRVLVRQEDVEQLARGIYRMAGQDYNEVDQFKVATLLIGEPSAVCLISALAHYDLTDVITRKIWIMVPHSKRSRRPELKLHRVRSPDWKIGIVKHKGYNITGIERTLVDALYYQRIVGTTIGIEALRRAVRNKKTTLSKVMDMADQLKVLHRILPYIEAMA
jgi:predicted transcriptional regulator of viral defense system